MSFTSSFGLDYSLSLGLYTRRTLDSHSTLGGIDGVVGGTTFASAKVKYARGPGYWYIYVTPWSI